MASRASSIVLSLIVRTLAVITVIFVAIIGVGLGLILAETANVRNQENFFEFAPALPTKILDINGNLVTEFAGDETRTLISIHELPRHLVNAILAREDPNFFYHKGFSPRAIGRAVYGLLVRRNLGGGSTITQQIAGTLYTNRLDRKMSRKLRELWWAFQMERRFSKNEILEMYLNQINMGPGVFGVDAASQFFFGHSAREVTLAEAAMLAILPSSPSRYNPLRNPNEAMDRQRFVLNRMISLGFTTQEEADASFDEYWELFDFTKTSDAAYYRRTDAAPWFSEYVRRELAGMLYGTADFHRDGFTVNTTLNLRHQEAAEQLMSGGLNRANQEASRAIGRSLEEAERTWRPVVELFSLSFNLANIHTTSDIQNTQRVLSRYNRLINPVLDMAALAFGIPELQPITSVSFAEQRIAAERSIVEGALISINNDTGHITAMIGGSRFDESNQFIRATQGNLQPGSSFKPLYYSAAIDSRRFTAASMINDLPTVFHNEDGTPYMPLNFLGRWQGPVLVADALAQSMNVASVALLDAIGFDAAIGRAAALLDYSNINDIQARFPRVYALGLGINSTSPIRMARAFAVFANQGREVTPLAIRSIEDRNGRTIIDLEQDLRAEQRRRGVVQVISPQNAHIVTSMLKRTVENGPRGHGTLYNPSGWGAKFTFTAENGRSFKMPVAGKTGTTQNWADAWTVGFSPYYTTAIWFGFDRPGNSLGLNLTGSTLAGPIWADYMREIHLGLPFRDFVRPSSGIVDATVCIRSGLLLTEYCNEGEVTLPFLSGTQPVHTCNYHGGNDRNLTSRIQLNNNFPNPGTTLDITLPMIRDEELLRQIKAAEQQQRQAAQTTRIPRRGAMQAPAPDLPSLGTLPSISNNPVNNDGTSEDASVEVPGGSFNLDLDIEEDEILFFYNPLID